MTKAVAARAREQLEEERGRLVEQLDELEEEGRIDTWRDSQPDLADAGTAAVEREQVQALADRMQRRLRQVDHALKRLDEGTYGLCEVCGEPIGDERLDALPAATTCVQHTQR